MVIAGFDHVKKAGADGGASFQAGRGYRCQMDWSHMGGLADRSVHSLR